MRNSEIVKDVGLLYFPWSKTYLSARIQTDVDVYRQQTNVIMTLVIPIRLNENAPFLPRVCYLQQSPVRTNI